MAAPGGVVGAYLHQAVAPGLGRIAGLVAVQSSTPLQGEAAAAAQVGGRGGLGLEVGWALCSCNLPSLGSTALNRGLSLAAAPCTQPTLRFLPP
jgi:hypothetical protein